MLSVRNGTHVNVQGVYEYTAHCNEPRTISPRERVGVQRSKAVLHTHPERECEGRKPLTLPPWIVLHSVVVKHCQHKPTVTKKTLPLQDYPPLNGYTHIILAYYMVP
jgi:hypothetical protein